MDTTNTRISWHTGMTALVRARVEWPHQAGFRVQGPGSRLLLTLVSWYLFTSSLQRMKTFM